MLTSSVRVNDHNSSFKFKSTIFGEFSKTFLKSRHQSSSNEPFFGEVFQNSPKSCHHSSSNQQFSWKFYNFPKPCYRSSKSFKSTIFGIFFNLELTQVMPSCSHSSSNQPILGKVFETPPYPCHHSSSNTPLFIWEVLIYFPKTCHHSSSNQPFFVQFFKISNFPNTNNTILEFF